MMARNLSVDLWSKGMLVFVALPVTQHFNKQFFFRAVAPIVEVFFAFEIYSTSRHRS